MEMMLILTAVAASVLAGWGMMELKGKLLKLSTRL